MDLNSARAEINEINNKLLELFEKRMKCSVDIAEYKLKHDLPVFDESREKFVLDSVSAAASDEMKPYVSDFFREIMDLSKSYQTHLLDNRRKKSYNSIDKIIPQTIVYQGVPGSYSSEICEEFKSNRRICVEKFEDVCTMLKNGEADYGVLPIENSSTGSVSKTYELLKKYNLYIVGERILRIRHNILVPKGGTLSDIKELYSHQQAFMQSSEYIETLGDVKLIDYPNTAASAKAVAEWNDKSRAAIASMNAAKIYNLDVVAEDISNNKNNYTRFIILSPEPKFTHDSDKVSMTFILKHECGSLLECLESFSEHRLNLLKLESRPIAEKPWQYIFFADFEYSPENGDISEIINEIGKKTMAVHFLGMYRQYA